MSSKILIYTSSSNNSIENDKVIKNANVGKIHQVKNPFANTSKINFEKRKSCGNGNRNQELFKRYYSLGGRKNRKKISADNMNIHFNKNEIKISKFKRINTQENLSYNNNNNNSTNETLSKKKNGLFNKIKKVLCCITDVRD